MEIWQLSAILAAPSLACAIRHQQFSHSCAWSNPAIPETSSPQKKQSLDPLPSTPNEFVMDFYETFMPVSVKWNSTKWWASHWQAPVRGGSDPANPAANPRRAQSCLNPIRNRQGQSKQNGRCAQQSERRASRHPGRCRRVHRDHYQTASAVPRLHDARAHTCRSPARLKTLTALHKAQITSALDLIGVSSRELARTLGTSEASARTTRLRVLGLYTEQKRKPKPDRPEPEPADQSDDE
jgi:hypothetical protein